MFQIRSSNARVPRPNFPFNAQDVAEIHSERPGEPGTWFRLHDGRVFKSTGEPDTTDPQDYRN